MLGLYLVLKIEAGSRIKHLTLPIAWKNLICSPSFQRVCAFVTMKYACRQMLEDNKVVQSRFALVVQERNQLRQTGDVSALLLMLTDVRS